MAEQFRRIELLLGKEKLRRIREGRVTVVGLGAVGSYAVEALARSGVGYLRLVDFDVVQTTNLNRNLLALQSTVGLSKADVARDRVKDINPQCRIEALSCFAAEENIKSLLDNEPQVLIDAIDAVNPKAQMLAAAYRRGIPIVSSMGAALRLDPRRIFAADLMDSKGCPLAVRIRKLLRQEGVGRGIWCVYSDEGRPVESKKAVGLPEEDVYQRGRPRRQLGSLPTIPGIFGLMVAHYALDILCGGLGDSDLTRGTKDDRSLRSL